MPRKLLRPWLRGFVPSVSEHLSFRAQKTKSSISTEISLVTFTTQIKPTRVLLLCQVHTLRMLVINTMSLLPCPWHLKSISCFTSRIYLEYLYVRYHHCSWIKVAQLYGRHRVISRDPTFFSANAPPTPTKFLQNIAAMWRILGKCMSSFQVRSCLIPLLIFNILTNIHSSCLSAAEYLNITRIHNILWHSRDDIDSGGKISKSGIK